MQPQRYWREIPQRYRLEAGRCRRCGKVFMPPRGLCDSCRSTEFETIRLADRGKVHTYTVIRVPPAGFAAQSPYVLAVVELDDGVRLTMQVADCGPDEVRVGLPVRVEFRKINEVGKSGVICYGYKVVPA
ncbi:MAG: Zn-ribbon domain-containing OB-fold protein [Elusimicrobia bacterium]|nr:Zn-ribbon domain-containing OB-fold protein [Elusimicrobiota bacterium]